MKAACPEVNRFVRPFTLHFHLLADNFLHLFTFPPLLVKPHTPLFSFTDHNHLQFTSFLLRSSKRVIESETRTHRQSLLVFLQSQRRSTFTRTFTRTITLTSHTLLVPDLPSRFEISNFLELYSNVQLRDDACHRRQHLSPRAPLDLGRASHVLLALTVQSSHRDRTRRSGH